MGNQMVDAGKGFHGLIVRSLLPAWVNVGSARRLAQMPIIALILSTLAFWVLYWFFSMGGFDHFMQRSAQRKEEARRREAREASRLAPLRAIEDPRDAAAILMLLIARTHGDPTREQIAIIEDKLRAVFGFERELTERMTQAPFLAKQTDSFEQAASAFSELFKRRLSRDERGQLIEMLEEVARSEQPSEPRLEAITAFMPMIGLLPAR
jgi:uncharacterized tellurite resistance protein B-like protein